MDNVSGWRIGMMAKFSRTIYSEDRAMLIEKVHWQLREGLREHYVRNDCIVSGGLEERLAYTMIARKLKLCFSPTETNRQHVVP